MAYDATRREYYAHTYLISPSARVSLSRWSS